MAIVEAALAASGVLAAAVTGWLGRKRARGRVKDTDAETLWQQLSGELAAVRADLTAYRLENIQLRAALAEANRKADEAHDEADQLRARVAHLEAKLARVEQREKGDTL